MAGRSFPSGPTFALLAATTFAVGIVYFVHRSQTADREVGTNLGPLEAYYSIWCAPTLPFSTQRMRRGVQRDIERQRRREENRRQLEEQIALQRRLEAGNTGQQQPGKDESAWNPVR